MILTRRMAIGGAAALAVSMTRSASAQARGPDYRAEAAALRAFAERTHPRGAIAAADSDWRTRWRAIAERARFDDAAYVAALRHALGWFADGHTNVLPFEFLGEVPAALQSGPFGRDFPLRAQVFHDGLWIVAAKDEAAPLLGARVTRIGGEAVEAVVRRFVEQWPSENPAWGHNWAALVLSSEGALQGSAAAPFDGRIEGALGGSAVSAVVRPRAGGKEGLTEASRTPRWHAQRETQHGRGNYVEKLVARGALYVSLNDVADAEGYAMSDLTRDVVSAFGDSEITRVVLDLRRNGGGDNELAEPLRHELTRSRFNRPAGLYVLIAPQTFSAAQNLANRLERETFALFGGEPTGSAPNLHGDPELFVGAETGLTAMVSTLLWQDGGAHDRRRWIFPDLFVPNTFADWSAGQDPVLEAALTHTSDTPNDFAARTRYFDRAGQDADWRPFWRA